MSDLFTLGCSRLLYQINDAERVASHLVRAVGRDKFTLEDVDLSEALRSIAFLERSLATISAEIKRAGAEELANGQHQK